MFTAVPKGVAVAEAMLTAASCTAEVPASGDLLSGTCRAGALVELPRPGVLGAEQPAARTAPGARLRIVDAGCRDIGGACTWKERVLERLVIHAEGEGVWAAVGLLGESMAGAPVYDALDHLVGVVIEEEERDGRRVTLIQALPEGLRPQADPPCIDRDGDGVGVVPSRRCRVPDLADCQDDDPEVSPLASERCDGKDTNCDGWVDGQHALVEACGTDTGRCQSGTRLCVDGAWGPCEGAVWPRAERCSGEDDDCDGIVDNVSSPLPGEAVPLCESRGVCAAASEPLCGLTAEGEFGWVCPVVPGRVEQECAPVREGCFLGSLDDPTCTDGVDNDCDGTVDANSPWPYCASNPLWERVVSGEPCFLGEHGRCRANPGRWVCRLAEDRCEMEVVCEGAVAPEEERCDGQDWDCDGIPDNRNDRDGDGFGDCPGPRFDCGPDDPTVYPGAPEFCNGIDNNCSGVPDDDVILPPGPCFTGIEGRCSVGAFVCEEGEIRCTPIVPVSPVEICGTGLDDNCSGIVDDGCRVDLDFSRLPALVVMLDSVNGINDFFGYGPRVNIAVSGVIGPNNEVGISMSVAMVATVDDAAIAMGSGIAWLEDEQARVILSPSFEIEYTDDSVDGVSHQALESAGVNPTPLVRGITCFTNRPGPDLPGFARCELLMGVVEVER